MVQITGNLSLEPTVEPKATPASTSPNPSSREQDFNSVLQQQAQGRREARASSRSDVKPTAQDEARRTSSVKDLTQSRADAAKDKDGDDNKVAADKSAVAQSDDKSDAQPQPQTDSLPPDPLSVGNDLLRHLEASMQASTQVSTASDEADNAVTTATAEESETEKTARLAALFAEKSSAAPPVVSTEGGAGKAKQEGGKTLPQGGAPELVASAATVATEGQQAALSDEQHSNKHATESSAVARPQTEAAVPRNTEGLPWNAALSALSDRAVPSSPDEHVAEQTTALSETDKATAQTVSSELNPLAGKATEAASTTGKHPVHDDNAAWQQSLASASQNTAPTTSATTGLTTRSSEGSIQLPGSLHLLNSQQAVPELAEKVTLLMGQKWQEAEIQLEPHGLGRLRIQLTIDQDQQANVHFVVQHGQTRELVEQALPRLRDMLAGQGLQLGQSTVQHQHADQSGGQQLGQSGQSGQGTRSDAGGSSWRGEDGAEEPSTVQNLAIHSTGPAGIDFYA